MSWKLQKQNYESDYIDYWGLTHSLFTKKSDMKHKLSEADNVAETQVTVLSTVQ